MKSPANPFFMIVMGALAATIPGKYLMAPPPAAPASTSADSSARAQATQVKSVEKTALDLVLEYVGSKDDTYRPLVHAMIVDLPDPIDAGNMDWGYDAGMIAVRRAAETKGFVIDRFWLPWTPEERRKRSASGARQWQDYPGAMLFRSVRRAAANIGRDTLQVVLVVGETPNGGVNKKALEAALAQIDTLRTRKLLDTIPTLRMVAPYFTGSARSLRLSLSSSKSLSGFNRIEFRTGSATQESIRGELNGISGVTTTVWSTVNSDFDLQHALVDAIQNKFKFDSSEVALLQESSTPYGGGQLGLGARGRDSASGEIPREFEKSDRTLRSYLRIPVPMHIASLRDQANTAPASEGPRTVSSSRLSAEVSLRDVGTNTDRPPSLSSLTPAAVDVAIQEITQALRARRIRAVGIIATDIKDKLFLAREVRRYLSDVQLFTTESNLLYLWPDYNDALRGMIVATSYPLGTESQEWDRTGPDQQLQVFTEEAAAGIFNAVLFHLGEPGPLLIDYAVPGSWDAVLRPPVWLLGVGRRSFVPLLITRPVDRAAPFVDIGIDPSRPLRAVSGPQSPPKDSGGPISKRHYALGLLLVVGFVFVIGRVRELRRTSREYALVEKPRAPKDETFADLRRLVFSRSLLLHQQMYTMIRDLALTAGVVAIAVVLLETAKDDGSALPWGLEYLPWILLLMGGVILIFSGHWVGRVWVRMYGHGKEYAFHRHWDTQTRRTTSLIQWPKGLDRRRVSDEPTPTSNGNAGNSFEKVFSSREAGGAHALWIIEMVLRMSAIVFAGGFAFLVTAMFRAAATGGIGEIAPRLFFHRAVQMGSGLSPLLPVLTAVAGFAAWATWHLSRISLLKRPVPFEAFSELDAHPDMPIDGLASALRTSARTIRKRLFLIVPDGKGFGLLVTLVLLGMALFFQFNPTLESIAMAPLVSGRTAFDLILAFSVLAALGSIGWGLYRFWTVWSALRCFLDELSSSPLLPAFERVPKRVTQLSQLTLGQTSTLEAAPGIAATQWAHLAAIHRASRGRIGTARPVINAVNALFPRVTPVVVEENPFDTGMAARFRAVEVELELERTRQSAMAGAVKVALEARSANAVATADPPTEDEIRRTVRVQTISERIARRVKIEEEQRVSEVAVGNRIRLLFTAIQEFWRNEPEKPDMEKLIASVNSSNTSENTGSTSGNVRRFVNDSSRLWLRAAEETMAVQVLSYVEWVLQHLRALALFLLAAVLIGTVLLSSYPFQPQSGVKMIFVGLLIATVGSVLAIGTQMNRDEVISRVTRSVPGRVTWTAGYVVNIIIFGLLPILTYVGSGVQPIRETVLTWFEPLARVLSQH